MRLPGDTAAVNKEIYSTLPSAVFEANDMETATVRLEAVDSLLSQLFRNARSPSPTRTPVQSPALVEGRARSPEQAPAVCAHLPARVAPSFYRHNQLIDHSDG